jgi:hypothetical protein
MPHPLLFWDDIVVDETSTVKQNPPHNDHVELLPSHERDSTAQLTAVHGSQSIKHTA